MRVLLKVNMPMETANAAAKAGKLGTTIQSILGDLKPEAAYFSGRSRPADRLPVSRFEGGVADSFDLRAVVSGIQRGGRDSSGDDSGGFGKSQRSDRPSSEEVRAGALSAMEITARAAAVADISSGGIFYRHEMNCQIVHDSIHSRPGWTDAYLLLADGTMVGYGLVAVAGPWKGKPTIFEFYMLPQYRLRVFDFFAALQDVSGAELVETQTNGPLLAIILLALAKFTSARRFCFTID